MGRMKKRLIAWFMVMTMVVTAIPVSVLAANEELDVSPVIEEENPDNDDGTAYVEDALPENTDGLYESGEENTGNARIIEEPSCILDEEVVGGNTNPANVTEMKILEPPTMRFVEGTPFHGNILNGIKVKIKYGDNKEIDFELADENNYRINLDGEEYTFGYGYRDENRNDIMDDTGNWKSGDHTLILTLGHNSGGVVTSLEFPVSVETTVKFFENAESLDIGETQNITENYDYLAYNFDAKKMGVYNVVGIDGDFREAWFFDENYKNVNLRDEETEHLLWNTAKCEAGKSYHLMIRDWTVRNEGGEPQLKVVNSNPADITDVSILQEPTIECLEGTSFSGNALDGMKVKVKHDGNKEEEYELHNDKGYTIIVSGEAYDFSYWPSSGRKEDVMDDRGNWKSGIHNLKLSLMHRESGREAISSEFVVDVKKKVDFLGEHGGLEIGETREITEDKDYLTYTFTADKTGIYSLFKEKAWYNSILFFDSNYNYVDVPENMSDILRPDDVYCEAGKKYYLLISKWHLHEESQTSNLKLVNMNPANVTKLEILDSPSIECLEGDPYNNFSLNGMKVRITYGKSKTFDYEFGKDIDWTIELDGEKYSFTYGYFTKQEDSMFDENRNWKTGTHKMDLNIKDAAGGEFVQSCDFKVNVKSLKDVAIPVTLGNTSREVVLPAGKTRVFSFEPEQAGVYKAFFTVKAEGDYDYQIIDSQKNVIKSNVIYTSPNEENDESINLIANMTGEQYFIRIRNSNQDGKTASVKLTVKEHNFRQVKKVQMTKQPQINYVEGIDWDVELSRFVAELTYNDDNVTSIYGTQESDDGYYAVWDNSAIERSSSGEIKAGDYDTKINVYSPEDIVVESFPIDVSIKTKEDFFKTATELLEGVGKKVSGDKTNLVYTFEASSTGVYKVLNDNNGDFNKALLYDMNNQLVTFPEDESSSSNWNTVYCEKDQTYYLVIKGWRNYNQDTTSRLRIIKSRKIDSIRLVTKPAKTNYFIWGEEYEGSGGLDYSGLSVNVSYSNGDSEVLRYDGYTNEKYQINCFMENGNNSETLEKGEYSVGIQVGDKVLNDAFKINILSSFDYIKANARQAMNLDEEIEGEINSNVISCFKFIPETDGTYLFEELSEGRGYLYDSAGKKIGNDNKYYNRISADLESGETYYYGIRYYGEGEDEYKVKVRKIKTIDSITLNVPDKVKSYVTGLQDKSEDAFWSGLSVRVQYTDGSHDDIFYDSESQSEYMITLGGEFMEKPEADLATGGYQVDVYVGTQKASFEMNVTSLKDYLSKGEFDSLEKDTTEKVNLKESLYQTYVFTALEEGYYRGVYQELTNTGNDVFLWVFDKNGQMLEDGTILLEKGQKVYYVLNNIWGKDSTYQFSVKNLDYILEKIEIIQEPYKKLYVDKLDCRLSWKPDLDFTGLKVRAYYSDGDTEDLELNQPNRDGVSFYASESYNFDEEPRWAGFRVCLDGISTEDIVKYPYITLEKYISDYAKDIPTITLDSEETVNGSRIGELYAFVPVISGRYQYYTTGEMPTQGSILDASGKELVNARAEGEENNFIISYQLVAGNTYYFLVDSVNYWYNLDTTVHLTKTIVSPPVPDITPTPAPEQNITVDVAPEKKEDGTIVIPESITPTQIADIEKSLEQADTNKDMVINVPQSEGSATEIPTDIIAKAIESKVDKLEIRTNAVDGDAESIEATFTLDVGQGAELNTDVSSINTGIKTTISDDAEKIVDKNIPSDAKTMKLELAHEGPFPVPVTISLSVDNVYKPGDIVYLYYINKESGKVELVGGKPLTVTADGKVEFTLEHASSYIITDKPEIEEEPSIKLNLKSRKLEAGSSVALKATVTPEDSKVQWKTSNGKVAAVNENGFVKALKPGTVTITASADNGLSATCKITVVITKMAVPTSVKAASQSYNSIKVTWKKVSNATKYYIYRATSKSGKYKRIGTAVNNNYTDKKLSTGKTYYYKVRAGYNKVYSSSSKAASAYPKPLTPVVKAKAGTKAITLSWKQISGATGYTVYRADEKGGKYKKVKTIGSGKTVKYADKSLKSRKTYYYKVRANRKIDDKKAIQSSSSKVVYAKTK